MMATADQVLQAFDAIRRAHRAGVYAPHKPLLILLALARVQRNEPRLVEFADSRRADEVAAGRVRTERCAAVPPLPVLAPGDRWRRRRLGSCRGPRPCSAAARRRRRTWESSAPTA
ncbi:MAG: hypothetical protein MZW92_44935 [Comamonadaceae bacterium]|nr:hypothetical protein [Comamonadaceae bacterium]